jgi:hypothetical protein
MARFSPITVSACRKAGIHLRRLGEGAFRRVYLIDVPRNPLVVKFPLGYGKTSSDYSEGIEHSRIEVRRIEKLAGFTDLRPHLPKILYFDKRHGVVVMRYYKSPDTYEYPDLLAQVLRKVVRRLTKIDLGDLGRCNSGVTGHYRRSRLILTDLGY